LFDSQVKDECVPPPPFFFKSYVDRDPTVDWLPVLRILPNV